MSILGSVADMRLRMRAVLPARWFGDAAPNVDAVLSGIGAAWSGNFGQLAYVRLQTRLATATEGWLDVIATDFFGTRIRRRPSQGDTPFRAVIQRELLRERATRPSLVAALNDLTGRAPIVFEPSRPADTGGYGLQGGMLGYGVAGGYGDLTLPNQMFVIAFRPGGSGVASADGWTSSAGGWGVGALTWTTPDQGHQAVTDADIFAAIAFALPVGAIAWTRIVN